MGKLSFRRGHEGNVSFISKTQFIEHYEKTLGAFHFGGRVGIIEIKEEEQAISKYQKRKVKEIETWKKTKRIRALHEN